MLNQSKINQALTSLQNAARIGDLATVNKILKIDEVRAQVAAQDHLALSLANKNRHFEIVKVLLACDTTTITLGMALTLLTSAVDNNLPETVKLLLEIPVIKSDFDSLGNALREAAKLGHLEIAQVLKIPFDRHFILQVETLREEIVNNQTGDYENNKDNFTSKINMLIDSTQKSNFVSQETLNQAKIALYSDYFFNQVSLLNNPMTNEQFDQRKALLNTELNQFMTATPKANLSHRLKSLKNEMNEVVHSEEESAMMKGNKPGGLS